MKELSIFVDESGDFGEYSHISPYYIVTFIFHNQQFSINQDVEKLNLKLENLKMNTYAIHTAPLIRREKVYVDLDFIDRFKIFNTLFCFTKKLNIKYKNIIVDKKHKDALDINKNISIELSCFIRDNLQYFQQFDKIIVYYDSGQKQLTNILISVFSTWFFDKFDYRKVSPYEYKLFQCADLICTLSLIEEKLLNNKKLTKSELKFFNSYSSLKKNYLKHLKKLEF